MITELNCMSRIDIRSLRIGNWVNLHKNVLYEPYQISSGFDLYKLDESDCADISPIEPTEKLMLEFGFEKHDSLIMDSYTINISPFESEYKVLSVTIEKHNQYIHLRNGDKEKDRAEDALITIFNSDVNGELFVHDIQNFYYILSGKKELVLRK